MTTILITVAFGLLVFAVFSLVILKMAKRPIPGAQHALPMILVIDDNDTVLNLIRVGLEDEGYTVLTADRPQDGVELFRQHSANISLVLLDFFMPEMTGDVVFGYLRQINTKVPVFLITDKIETTRQLRDNVNGYLLKPFRLGDLVGKVRVAMSMT